jgi:hypothetical protein
MHDFLRIAGDLTFWARNVNLQLVKTAANLMDTTVYGDWLQRLARTKLCGHSACVSSGLAIKCRVFFTFCFV